MHSNNKMHIKYVKLSMEYGIEIEYDEQKG